MNDICSEYAHYRQITRLSLSIFIRTTIAMANVTPDDRDSKRRTTTILMAYTINMYLFLGNELLSQYLYATDTSVAKILRNISEWYFGTRSTSARLVLNVWPSFKITFDSTALKASAVNLSNDTNRNALEFHLCLHVRGMSHIVSNINVSNTGALPAPVPLRSRALTEAF